MKNSGKNNYDYIFSVNEKYKHKYVLLATQNVIKQRTSRYIMNSHSIDAMPYHIQYPSVVYICLSIVFYNLLLLWLHNIIGRCLYWYYVRTNSQIRIQSRWFHSHTTHKHKTTTRQQHLWWLLWLLLMSLFCLVQHMPVRSYAQEMASNVL